MECNQAQLLISREIDGELAQEERLALEQHLSQCSDCAAYARRCRALQKLIDSRRREPEQTEARPAVLPGATPAGRSVALYRLAAALLAAAGVAFFCLWVGERAAMKKLRADLARHHATGSSSPTLVGAVPAVSLHQDAAERAEYVAAFRALGDYFQGSMHWVAMDGPQMELGVSSHPGTTPTAAQGEAAVVNVRVVAVGPGDESRVLSSPTVLIRPGAQAEFRFREAEGGQGRELAYRCAWESESDGLAVVGVTIQGGSARRPIYLWGAVQMDDDGSGPAAYARVGKTRYILILAARPLTERGGRHRQAL